MVPEGAEAIFEVQLAHCRGLQVTWYKDGLILFDCDNKHLFTSDEYNRRFYLSINSCHVEDACRYGCHAKNSLGEATSYADLYVAQTEVTGNIKQY